MKDMTRRTSVVGLIPAAFLFLSFLVMVQTVYAAVLPETLTQGEREWLETHAGDVELWFNPDFPPVEYSDHSGVFTGMGAEVIAILERRLGVSFTKNVCPDWTKHLEGLKNGNCAIAPTIVRTPEREAYIRFTTPYARVPVVIIATEDLGRNLSLDDLAGKRVAVVKGYATENYIRQQARGRFDVVTVDGVEEGLKKAAFRTVDAYVENLAVASYYISKNGIASLSAVGTTDYSFDFSIGVSHKYPLLHSALQKALDTMNEAQLQDVRNHWISLKLAGDMGRETIHMVISGGLILGLIIVGLGVFTLVLRRLLAKKTSSLAAAHQEIERIDARFRELFYRAPVPLVEMGEGGQVLGMNEAMVKALGYSVKDIPNLDAWFRTVYPDPAYRDQVRTEWSKAVKKAKMGDGRIEQGEFKICCKDGTSKVFLIGASLIGDSVVGSLVDIDERKRMELELEMSRERFFTLFELAPFSCVINDFDGRYILVNQYFCETFGQPRDRIVGRTMKELGRIVDAEDAERIMEDINQTGSCPLREIAMYDLNSSQVRYSMFASRIIDWGDRKAILSATVNITEKKLAEEELKRNEESLRVTLDSIGDAVIATDTDGCVVRMNPIAESLTGWTMDEARGRPLREVFVIVNTHTRQPVDDPVAIVLATNEIVGLANHTVLIARGGNEFQIADSGAPIRNSEGTILGVVLVFRDVTQEYALQEQLRQSQKMQALGQLAGGVAHDFNNMLAAIMGAAELLGDVIDSSEPQVDNYLKMIIRSAERAAGLTKKLLTFSRKKTEAMQQVNVHDTIRDALAMISHTMDRRIQLEVRLLDEAVEVMGDPAQLQNAFLNLLINATHAMPAGGTLTVNSQRVDLDASTGKIIGFTLEPGAYIEIEIRDTGCGIPREDIARIFEPFFTTKDPGKGTGLGLFSVFGTLEKHRGGISVYSELGQGTSFQIFLPLTDDAARKTQDQDTRELPEGTGRILVVDDEPAMRDIGCMILARQGYDVVPAENGRHAISLFEEEKGVFDLVILDMVMPQMNGRDCFKVLKQLNPQVRVILSSGFAKDDDVEVMQAQGLFGFIRKPFRKAELVEIVRDALAG